MKRGRAAAASGVAALILLGAIVTGIALRLNHRHSLTADASEASSEIPVVETTVVEAPTGESDITLPGGMQAIQEAAIYARSDGYMRRRLADIGDKVKAGALLAEIEAPEVDQQLAQARAGIAHVQAAVKHAEASLQTARTHLELARLTAERWKQLTASGAISKQENDEKQNAWLAAQASVEAEEASVHAAQSDVAAQEANVRRVEQMKGFQRVVAPFDGVITARNFDAGALITSGSTSEHREIFRMAKIDSLRIFVGVPQNYAPFIQTGQPAVVRVTEFADREFPGRVARTSSALDPSSRTLLTEVHIPNAGLTLLPGMFCSVRFHVGLASRPVVVPSAAILFGTEGPRAVVVDGQSIAHVRKVKLGKDLGHTLEINSGVKAGDRLILNAGDDLRDGQKVSYQR